MPLRVYPPASVADYGAYEVPPEAASAGGGGAPVNAQYVVMALDATLTNERKLTAGTDITIVDGGANGNVTISVTNPPSSFNWGKATALQSGYVKR